MNPFNIIGKTKKEIQGMLTAYQQAIDYNIICSLTDFKGTILYVNKKFCEISKYSEKELLGQNHRIVNSGFHPKGFFKQMWRTIGKGNLWQNEIKNKAKDGTYYWVDTVILPIRDNARKIIQFFSLRMPINERKEVDAKREQHIKVLEEMLFMTSHKVRQHIANILGLSNILYSSKNEPEEFKIVVDYLKKSALNLDKVTQELNLFIHSEKQKAEN